MPIVQRCCFFEKIFQRYFYARFGSGSFLRYSLSIFDAGQWQHVKKEFPCRALLYFEGRQAVPSYRFLLTTQNRPF